MNDIVNIFPSTINDEILFLCSHCVVFTSLLYY